MVRPKPGRICRLPRAARGGRSGAARDSWRRALIANSTARARACARTAAPARHRRLAAELAPRPSAGPAPRAPDRAARPPRPASRAGRRRSDRRAGRGRARRAGRRAYRARARCASMTSLRVGLGPLQRDGRRLHRQVAHDARQQRQQVAAVRGLAGLDQHPARQRRVRRNAQDPARALAHGARGSRQAWPHRAAARTCRRPGALSARHAPHGGSRAPACCAPAGEQRTAARASRSRRRRRP